ncbi:MAG: hypothetical protein NPIRA04_04980 [Nitrospirales bacterium]|nr:MAG: hypothetical protein NPIRA04_04980 [Nitrospirales bacterium]
MANRNIKLFAKTTNPLHVRQRGIAGCPLPAAVAAVTRSCPQQLQAMVQETKGQSLVSWFDDETPRTRFTANRMITVKFHGWSVRLTPFLYFTSGNRLRFASSTDGAGYVSYIEKAYVMLKGAHRYENLDAFKAANPLTVSRIMIDLVGPINKIDFALNGTGEIFQNLTKPRETIPASRVKRVTTTLLRTFLKKANPTHLHPRATIATTRDSGPLLRQLNLVGFHTYAVLSFSNDRVRVFEAMRGTERTLSLHNFRRAFDTVLQARMHSQCR